MPMVTINSTDAVRLARWWAEQTDGEVVTAFDDAFLIVRPGPEGAAPLLGFQRVDAVPAAPGRIHLDWDSDDRAADVARLVEAGASELEEHTLPGHRWTVMADPDGNVFCVSSPDPTATDYS